MAKWYLDEGFQSDVVLSTRVRLARNIEGLPFPNRMSDADGAKLISMVEQALSRLNYQFRLVRMDEIDDLERQKLMEEHFISPDMLKNTKNKAVFISADDSVSILVGEEDHLRLQSMFSGLEAQKAYDLLDKVDAFLAKELPYAYHEKYGFLTACPTNVGTGMRLSFMMHLPALCKTHMADSLFSTIGKLGITVRGLYGEGTKSQGDVFQVSNQVTLGRSETEIMDGVTEVVNQIIAKERELRSRMMQENGAAIEDTVFRALGTLRYARILPSAELNSLLSHVRMGVSVGLIPDVSIRDLNTVMVLSRPGHVMDDRTLTSFERDVKRASLVRQRLNREPKEV